MHFVLGSLVLGAVAGEGARKVTWRPLLRGAIKNAVLATRKVNKIALAVRKEAEELVAEARAELDSPSESAAPSFDI